MQPSRVMMGSRERKTIARVHWDELSMQQPRERGDEWLGSDDGGWPLVESGVCLAVGSEVGSAVGSMVGSVLGLAVGSAPAGPV